MDCAEHSKKKYGNPADKKIQRFSKIETEKDVPFFKLYSNLPDPVMKQEKRKLKSVEFPLKKPNPKMKMKCVGCKDKKAKKVDLEKEQKKLEKYIAPIAKWQQLENEERHKKEKEKYFVCKKEIIRMPSPIETVKTDERKKLQYASATKKEEQKVIPEKLSMTESTSRWPPEPTFEELVSRIPKSRIVINKTKKKGEEKKYPAVDSVDYIYNAKYRQLHPWYEMYRGMDVMSFYPDAPAPSTVMEEEMEEEEEETMEEMPEYQIIHKDYEEMIGEDIEGYPENYRYLEKQISGEHIKPPSKLSALATRDDNDEDEYYMEEGGEEEEIGEVYSYFEKMSAATSIASEYRIKYPADDQYDTLSMVPSVMNRILQKYTTDSDDELITKPDRPAFEHGTIKSHSTTKVPLEPKSFFFGVISGTYHYGSRIFSEESRFMQGLPMCVAAYIVSIIKPAPKWLTKDVDLALHLGDKLYLKSLELLHLHESPRILSPEELNDIVEISDKKIKYKIEEPDIAGYIMSNDAKVYNLLKGLTLFFNMNRAGILQTYNTNILIFKYKHFFVFDPEPRDKELYATTTGTAILASFYDIQSIMIMLWERGNLQNWPFIISKISIRRIVTVESKDETVSLSSNVREESLYQIINPLKAIVRATMNIDDSCFGDSRNKQAIAVATIALVYSHISAACSWHKKIIDKIIMIANQFYIECLKDTDLVDLKLENIPAFFTIGPMMVEILIYSNQYAGLMYRKTECLFETLLTKFFCSNSAAIVEIDNYAFAVWKDKKIFYCFDPYSRDHEGRRIKDGQACVTMNANLKTLIDTILYNFNVRSSVFRIHVLKVVRINRDPQYAKPTGLHGSEESIIEKIKVSEKRATVIRSVTVDTAELAAKEPLLEVPLEPSIIEIGSTVESIDQKFVPKFPLCLERAVVKYEEVEQPKIIDLDSASLSDTQIEKDKPSPLKKQTSFEFRLLEEILREEMELNKLMELRGEGYEGDEIEEYEIVKVEMEDEIVQKGVDYGMIDKKEEYMMTDIMGLYPVAKQVLEPNKPVKVGKRKVKPQKRVFEEEVPITQSQEFAKPSNFIRLPDGSEILYATKNIANLGEDYDDAVPFVNAIAAIMAKKYTLNTWSIEVADAILDYGYAVYKSVGIKFSDVPKIEIPRITIGSSSYKITMEYIFDSLLAQAILEQCLEKLIFRQRDSCLIVTSTYCCSVYYKRTLYYMFDSYGNNLVGLGEGPDNNGVACMFRFRSINALVGRFLYNKRQRELLEPSVASRFVISSLGVQVIYPPPIPMIPRRENQLEPRQDQTFESDPEKIEKEKQEQRDQEKKELMAKNKIGYQKNGKYLLIEGSSALNERDGREGKIKPCHFICICAMIGLFSKPVKAWDTKRVDYVQKMGKTLFGYVDNMNFADKRNISNILFDKYFFDIIVKRIVIANMKIVKNLRKCIDQLLIKHKFVLIQFLSNCYVLYKTGKKFLHLFDPYGAIDNNPKACWIKFENRRTLIQYIKKRQKGATTFFFYNIFISNYKRASKKHRLEFKLRTADVKQKPKPKKIQVFTESEDWLTEYPIPWSRMKKHAAARIYRGAPTHKWFQWDVEYPNDLYSMTASIHQCDTSFGSKSRNKQTIANCIVSIIMTEMYDFTEWNTDIMDSILKEGDHYFRQVIKKITEKNYEIKIEDFPLTVTVFPYSVNIDLFPLLEGTMFVVRPQQFNLSKALRYFFESYENRCGIICCSNGESKTKFVAFGRVRENEYFMYDCQTIGPPMFVDRMSSKAYVLRCVTLNRLLHILTVTLRSGDFFIYYVGISEEQGEREVNVENLEVSEDETKVKTEPEDDEAKLMEAYEGENA